MQLGMHRKIYEKPQSGNPHQLTVLQHILPRRSIERFCDQQGVVRVKRIAKEGFISVPPNNPLFCAKRVWDQRAETVVSSRIEVAFQNIADALVASSVGSLEQSMHLAVTKMYLLWRHRAIFSRNPYVDLMVNCVATERELSIDAQELLESKNVLFARPDGSFPGRFLTGIAIQRAIDMDLNAGADRMRWGVIRTPPCVEFIVPDAFINQPVMPVSPSLCLVSGLLDCHLSLAEVGRLNREALFSTHSYWFARVPDRCPVWRRTLL